ncbi:hypothetical protein [Pseudomonas phage vB_PaeP_YA3]|nr:hypothetical protein [Pseudomonas phage vB_PaeP_YA3]
MCKHAYSSLNAAEQRSARPPSRPLFRQFGNPLLRQRRETLGEAKDAARAGPDSPAVQAHALHATLLKSPANRPKKRTQEWERTPTRRSDRDDTDFTDAGSLSRHWEVSDEENL